MSHNTFGHLFRVTTWGESHGPALGCVVDGCPPGIALTEADIQPWLDRRRPGQGKFVTQRQEPDAVRILSGVFQDERSDGQRTTGTPISMIIDNVDQRSRDYSEIAQAFRPGHADYPYFAKYGVRDYRGGGRQSARETAARVAAGGVARKIIEGVTIRGAVVQIGPHAVDPQRIDFGVTGDNEFWAPDPDIVPVWTEHLEKVRKAGSSTGAVVAVEATGVPAGWGAPLYGKLDAELAAALMSINAAKGVEIGAGFGSAALSGEENADEMRMGNDGAPLFLSNKAGGVLGGISTGQAVTARVAFKPTSSILSLRRSINEAGEEIELRTKGRHDPCVGIRAVPVVEAMVACVLADAFLRHRAQTGGAAFTPGR
ncbi:MAG: chorismate synthase [Phenylobacterium sp.]|uniref:chorismate synthase n=1 Tax=Phenylobacterium sp. TaxID=1871053 RepID=UPI0012106750|nr:chorismate synthase [Phenylobacterium sp.]TAL30515.1 MAG: chorismate synthase [Phenylobacterium sp.]